LTPHQNESGRCISTAKQGLHRTGARSARREQWLCDSITNGLLKEFLMASAVDFQAASKAPESRPNGLANDPAPTDREVRYEHSRNFPAVLEHLGASLLVSTYQAGKLFVVGARQGSLALSFHNFEQAMGIAVKRDQIAVGTRNQIWSLRAARDIASRLEPAGRYDDCFLARGSHFTGDIHGHELAWAGDELWVVNTTFSCLCTLHENYSFVPRWRPPFISALAPEDRCHLNGLALTEGEGGIVTPQYVTALAETDTPGGWRANKAAGGSLIHVPTGRTVVRGFAMPHSPRIRQGRVWLLDSGTGRLVVVDPTAATVETVTALPGYTRGLAFHDHFAFVGLSKIRETSTFGGMPIAERRAELKCGVGVVDLRTGRLIAHLELKSGVEEIFAVQVLPGIRFPAVSGPYPEVDGVPTIWSAPGPDHLPINNP
jgi:uncharacterized protein (TIGR03032 family)